MTDPSVMKWTLMSALVSLHLSVILVSIECNVWQTNDNEVPIGGQTSRDLYEKGKDLYEGLVKKEIMYGQCWRSAVQSLRTSCSRLDESVQSRLALTFANCFLERSGLQTYPCDDTQDIAHCIRDMTDRAFNAYTEFFTHTQSVCFYLSSELWQQKTESTVDRLTQTAHDVKDRLEDASQQLNQLNDLQELSITSQKGINDELMAAKNTIDEFRHSSAEQRFIVKEILDRFIRLQDFVLIEMSYGYSIVFFVVSMIIVYFMTTPVRTNDARLWLFVVLVINLFVERLIASYSVDDDLISLKSTSIIISERIWLSRKITLTLITAIFVWFAVTYKNYGYVNHSILTEHTLRLNHIQSQLNQICKTVESSPQKTAHCVDTRLKEYSSDSDSDFTADSGNNSDESEVSDASIETCSTVEVMVTSSTNKSNENDSHLQTSINEEKLDLMPELVVSPQQYNLRPRKSITYTKSGIINESVNDFIEKVKLSENVSKSISQITTGTTVNVKGFLSSDED